MEKDIKLTIDARKNAIFSSYKVEDKKLIDKIDNLFERINEFGEGFKDVAEFEKEFANSSLNSEYINIFTEIAQQQIDVQKPSIGAALADSIGSEIETRLTPSRAVMADARDSAIRDIPVVGDVIDAKQKFDLFNKFRRKK